MKFIVTGIAGFIGSNLASKLSKSGHSILGIDNFSAYYSTDLKEHRMRVLVNPAVSSIKRLDLCDLQSLKKIIDEFRPETIIHLAAQPGVRTPLAMSQGYIQNNIVAFSSVLQAAVESEVQNFLYASSSSVYGNSTNLPYREDDMSIKPINIYGATKLANEILAPAFVAGSRTRARGMRFFTVYGPWGRPDMAYFRIINSILNNHKFQKFGGGEIKRDFTYIDDITSMIERLSSELILRPAGYSDIVNIGGGNPYSLNELITVISEQLGSNPDVLMRNSNPSDTNFTSADTTKLLSLTGSLPLVDLESGIRETIAWAKYNGVKNSLNKWVNSTN